MAAGPRAPRAPAEILWDGLRRAQGVAVLVGSDGADPVLDLLAAGMAALGFEERQRQGMRLAAVEALANAWRHGNGGDASKRIVLGYALSNGRVRLQVWDEGAGFDPRHVPDPTGPDGLTRDSGRGLLLMRHFSTRVRFNRRGNCVTLIWRRPGGTV